MNSSMEMKVENEKSPGRVVLQERDKLLLKYCYEQGFLSFEFVQKNLFPGTFEQRVRDRLKRLERAGFIQRKHCPNLSPKRIVTLAKAGVEVAQSLSRYQVRYLETIDYARVIHDDLLTDIRYFFEHGLRNLSFKWTPERYLKTWCDAHTPDGIIQAVSSDGRLVEVAIELELSRKSTARYQKIFTELASFSKRGWVLYLVETASDLDFILERIRVERRGSSSTKFGYWIGVALLADRETHRCFKVHTLDHPVFDFPQILPKGSENV